MITFQRLTRADGEWLKKLTRVFRHEEISTEKVNALLADNAIWIEMANDGDQVCGYVLAYVLPRIDQGNDMLMIYHVFVQEAYQRRHIAETLVNRVLEAAKAADMHYTFLITQTRNAAACALYQKLGGQLHEANNAVYYWYGSGKPQL